MPLNFEDAQQAVEKIIEPKQLSKIQRLVFQYTWQGLSYLEIARITGYDEGYIKDTGSRLWQMLSEYLGQKVTKQSLQVTLHQYLTQPQIPQKNIFPSAEANTVNPSQDWGEAIDTSIFYGRNHELTQLSQWIVQERCRLIAILGMGGMGKTTLSVKLAEQIQGEFDYLFWRSLRNPPPLDELLSTLLRFLSQEDLALSSTESGKIAQLQACLRTTRCLIVLDNFDALFAPTEPGGTYRSEYRSYGELLRQIGESRHQSCLIITSRETPSEVALFQGENLAVREWQLLGLETSAAFQLLATKGVHDSQVALNRLIECYRGNPLALKIAASSIQGLFAGNVTDFLRQGVIIFNGIRELLKSQIERLSDLEQQVMVWLAINRDPVSFGELQTDLIIPLSSSRLLEILESLKRRSLVERTVEGFTQHPIVTEYLTEGLITQMSAELSDSIPLNFSSYLNRYVLLKATARDEIRHRQIRIIVEPVVNQAITSLGNQQELIERLNQHLWELRKSPTGSQGYGVGNLLNLLIYLRVDLTGADFSHLSVRQAYLAEVNLNNVNFSYVDFRHCVFTESLEEVSHDNTAKKLTSSNLKPLHPLRLYDGMNIIGATGLTQTQKEKLKALGAIEK